MTDKVTDTHILELVDDVMEIIKEAGNPQNAALILLACHAMNYELHGPKGLTLDQYLKIYNEQFKGFFKDLAQWKH